jgi:hypothetical protein
MLRHFLDMLSATELSLACSIIPAPSLTEDELRKVSDKLFARVEELRYVKEGDEARASDVNDVADFLKDLMQYTQSYLKLRESTRKIDLTQYYCKLSAINSFIAKLPHIYSGDVIDPSHHNLIVDTLWKLKDFLSEMNLGGSSISKLEDILSKIPYAQFGDVIDPSHHNLIVDALWKLKDILAMKPPVEVYLFNQGDWSTAKSYVTDGTIVFVDMDINTLSSNEVQQLVSTKHVVFAVMIDTQPSFKNPAPAFYPVFYTVLAPPSCGYDTVYVTDSCFASVLGSSVHALWDYCVSTDYKVSGVKKWTGYLCGWGYKVYEAGAIIEIPYDGAWMFADYLGQYVDSITKCLLGWEQPSRIIYLAGYTSDLPLSHYCYPADQCWEQLCNQRKWVLIDKRTK